MSLEQQFDGVDVLLVDGVQQGVPELHPRTEQQLHHLNVLIVDRNQQRRPDNTTRPQLTKGSFTPSALSSLKKLGAPSHLLPSFPYPLPQSTTPLPLS